MYLSKENKKKVFLAFAFIALSTASVIAGKTLATGLILVEYPTSVLPYFYFSLAFLMILSTIVTGKYQEKYQQEFTIIIKLMYLVMLLIFMVVMKFNIAGSSFVIAILVLSLSSFTPVLAWNYVSDIFNIQEFKQYSKIFQVSSSVGAITVGGIIALISAKFNPIFILGLLFLAELLSLFCVSPLSKYLPQVVQSAKKSVQYSPSLKENSIYKNLVYLSIASFIISLMVDYSLKLSLVESIDKEKISSVVNLIYVISVTAILVLQMFFLDRLLRVLGSKKIVLIYPLVLLVASIGACFSPNFIGLVLLFLVNDVFFYTTSALSRSLYTNILPIALRRAARVRLNGIIKPVSGILASCAIWSIGMTSFETQLSIALVIVLSAWSLYLAIVLTKKYILQLTQSVYLRRFKPELINMSQIDQRDFDYLVKQALNFPDSEATLFGLQLLVNDRLNKLPDSLSLLLVRDDPIVVREVAQLIAQRRDQRDYVDAAMNTFFKSEDDDTKWYLALYLIEQEGYNFLPWADTFLKNKNYPSQALVCLIFLKQGDLNQQRMALELLIKMSCSTQIEEKKWFLLLLVEFSFIQAEKYLIQCINQDPPPIKILALQQVRSQKSNELINTLLNHIGAPSISHAVNTQLISSGESILNDIEEKLNHSNSYRIKLACIQIISQITSNQSELLVIKILTHNHDVFLKTMLAKYLAFKGVKSKISPDLKKFLVVMMKTEVQQFYVLTGLLVHYDHQDILDEIHSRLELVKKRVLYFLTAIIGSLDILNSVPILTSAKLDKSQQAIALEIIDATSEDRVIANLLMQIFIEIDPQKVSLNVPVNDQWLTQYIHKIESNNMESIYTLTKLRKVELFKNLPAETLQVLAECCSSKDMVKDEIIFQEGEQGDGLYVIDSGEVVVTKQQIEINRLCECAYFGELALLSNLPRFATVTALSDGVLFYIDKQDFDRITDEIPEIMKSINKQIIHYLTANMTSFTLK